MRAEQRKQRHSDGTGFHHTEKGCIKAEPRLQHDGYTVAWLDTFGPEDMRPVMNALTAREGHNLLAPVGVRDPDSSPRAL